MSPNSLLSLSSTATMKCDCKYAAIIDIPRTRATYCRWVASHVLLVSANVCVCHRHHPLRPLTSLGLATMLPSQTAVAAHVAQLLAGRLPHHHYWHLSSFRPEKTKEERAKRRIRRKRVFIFAPQIETVDLWKDLWMARGRVNSLVKFSASSQILGKGVIKKDDPNSHYLSSMWNTTQTPYTNLVARMRIKHFTQPSN